MSNFSDAKMAEALAAVPDLPAPNEPEAPPVEGAKTEEVKAAVTPKTETVEAPADEKTARRFADLSKRDQQLRQKESAWKAETSQKEAELSAKQAKVDVELKRAEELASFENEVRVNKNFKPLFDRLGITYEDLAHAKLTGKFDAATEAKLAADPVKKQLDAIEKRIEQDKKDRQVEVEKAQTEAAQRAAQNYKSAVADVFQAGADKYEFLAAELSPQQVADAVHAAAGEFYNATKGQKDLPPMAKFLEAMETDAEDRFDKATKTKKFQTKYGGTKIVERVVEKVVPGKPAALSATMTANESQPRDRRETEDERFARALASMTAG